MRARAATSSRRSKIARRVAPALIAVIASAALVSASLGFWSGSETHGAGDGTAGAAAVSEGSAPTVSETGSTTVLVTWGNSSLSNGRPVDGYLIRRYDEATGTEATPIGAGCAGKRTDTSCTETATPVGDWAYTVTPVFATHWRGAESAKSGAVNTGAGSMTLAQTLFGGTVAPLPAPVTGTISGFGPGDALTYTLDDDVLAGASPSQAAGDGTATISLTIPAGTSDGPHSITVTGAGAEASVGIIVDNTAPTISTVVTPAPNAAGWHDTSPVEVGGTVSDGDGSGVAFVKYTTDGSNPKTNPNGTAQIATAPVAVPATTTLRFYLADLAGNESAVLTEQINVDTAIPLFTVEFVDVTGGAYQGPVNVVTGEPGVTFYRGAEAGSMRFLMTPVGTGGSPLLGASFTALPPDAVGFSFDSSAVTAPAGGPYLSNVLSWAAGTTSTASGTISLTDAAGNTLGGPGELRDDSTAPAGGSVDASGLVGSDGRYSSSLGLSLQLAKGTDALSGLADGTATRDAPATLQRASAELSSSDGVAAGTCGVYSAYAAVGPDNPAATFADTVPADHTCYRYRYLVADHVGNVATYTSPDIKVLVAPAPLLKPTDATLSAQSGVAAQSISGKTVYYNPAQSGSFNVDTSSTASYSGIDHVSFPAIAGFTGGGAVSSPTTGTTFRSTYSWSSNAATASPGVQALSATNHNGQTATNSAAFSVVKDATAPTGGSVDFLGLGEVGERYSASMTLSVVFAPGTDAGAGVAAGGAKLERASASLTSNGVGNGTCGTFGAYNQVGADDRASPATDVVPVDRTCYRYRYLVLDKVGNQATYVSSVIKVNSSAPPAPTLTFSALSNAYWNSASNTLAYRPAASSGGFTVTALSADTSAGISGYTFPAFPAGWTSSSGGAAIQSYGWTAASPTAPGARIVTATTYAGTQASTSFTVAPDAAPPSGGSLMYTNGYSLGSTVSISFGRGTDPLSGLDLSSSRIETSTATMSDGVCATFGAFVTGATNPVSGVSLPVVTDTCYRYRYVISDNLGNQAVYTSASVTKVDQVAPANAIGIVSPVSASLRGGMLFFKGDVAGSFRIVNAITDAGSGPASATFPAIATTGWTHDAEIVTTPAGGPYTSSSFSWTPGAGIPPTISVNGTDRAGKTGTSGSIRFENDTAAPTGGNISYPNGVVNSTSVPIAITEAGDPLSYVDPATATIKRDVAPLTTTTQTCGTFPGTFATTVTLVGGADTSTTSGNCYRYRYLVSDKVGNQATFTSASVAKVDTSGPRVTAIVSQQSNGGTGNGTLESGDRLVLTFNQSLAAASVPATFTGATETTALLQSTKLTIPGITDGPLDTGGNAYVFLGILGLTSVTFNGTVALVNAGTATTVTVTVTTITGGASAAGSGALVFKPAPTITDGGANAASGTFTTPVAFKLF